MPRLPHDAYMTPPHYLGALLGDVNLYGHVIEPCAGDGAIVRALELDSAVLKITTNDLDRQRKADFHFDAATDWPTKGLFDWAVTNTPFSAALGIIEQMLDHAHNVAVLTRLSFLEPCEDREYLLESRRPTQVIVLPRYSFRLNDRGKRQTDNVTCCWLVWHADGQQRGVSVWGRGKSEAMAIVRGLL